MSDPPDHKSQRQPNEIEITPVRSRLRPTAFDIFAVMDILISCRQVLDGMRVRSKEVAAPAKLPLHSAGPDDDPGP